MGKYSSLCIGILKEVNRRGNFDKVKDIIVDRLGVDADKVTEDASFKR